MEVDASVKEESGLDVCLFHLLPEGVGEGELSGPRAVGVRDARAGEDEASGSCYEWLGATSLRVLARKNPPLLLPDFEGFPDLVRDPMGP